MYQILTVNESPVENLWTLLCAKFKDSYRYYGLVYNTEYDYCVITLMDENFTIIDHFKQPKNNSQDAKECFLDFCISFDKFWHPELFASQEKKPVD